MTLESDIITQIGALFRPEEQNTAIQMVEAAKMHDNTDAGPRCQRCAVAASKGKLQSLHYYLNLLKIDYRDVIVAGEYDVIQGKLTRVRDLNLPFPGISPIPHQRSP